MCKSSDRIRSHISLIWLKIGKFSFLIFYFDPIINLIFAVLLSWLDLKLKFSGYRILNRWLSYNSQTQVASTVFFKKTVFFYLPAGYRIVLVGALSMQNYCFGLTYERSYLTFPAPKIVDPKSSKVYQVDPMVGFKLYH